MTAAMPPTALDLRASAQKAETLSGQALLSAFARLADGLPELEVGPVRWSARAELRQPLGELGAELGRSELPEPQLWLHLQASAELPQTCQRCLSPYAQPVEVDRWFRFVADEAVALAEDEDCEEDLLAFEPRFDLAALVEDELLLALPLVPMHEVCPQPVRMSAGELPDLPEEKKPNPFAALSALKGRASGH